MASEGIPGTYDLIVTTPPEGPEDALAEEIDRALSWVLRDRRLRVSSYVREELLEGVRYRVLEEGWHPQDAAEQAVERWLEREEE